jgi:hypothetical protein
MKIWTPVIVASAILAFTASAGTAALGAIPGEPGSSAGPSGVVHATTVLGSSAVQTAHGLPPVQRTDRARRPSQGGKPRVTGVGTARPSIRPMPYLVTPTEARSNCRADVADCDAHPFCVLWRTGCTVAPTGGIQSKAASAEVVLASDSPSTRSPSSG